MKELLNDEILTLKEVLLIDENGNNLGMKDSKDALRIADNKNLDLVLISDNTAKIMDYGKFSFDRKKEKKQKAVKVKEVKFGLNIASHDFSLKVKKIREFLKQNHVLIKVEMRGRELNNIENGFNLFKKILLELDIVGEGTFSEKTISLMVNKK